MTAFRSYIIFVVFMLAALLGCKHETLIEPGPCDAGYSLKYYFVYDGDTLVRSVTITVSSYNARVDSSYEAYRVYQDSINPTGGIAFLSETIDHSYYSENWFNCFTPGSTKWMKIDIRLSHPDSAANVIHRMEFVLSDTNWVKMYEPEDFTEIFTWPEDTNRYIKVTDYWIN